MRVLLALPLALAACGDNLSGPLDPNTDGVDPSGATETDTTARYAPAICDVQSYPTVQVDSLDSAVRAVPFDGGAALFMVPKTGGVLRGVLVDGRGSVVGDPAGTKLAGDAAFTGLAASRVDERFIVNVVAGDRTRITAVRDDLGDVRELADVEGALVGDRTMMQVRGTRVATTGGPKGMVATSFDMEWTEMGTGVVAQSVPISMSSAAYGTDAMIAWSTTTECHLTGVGSQIEATQPYACKNNRIAVDFAQRGGWMVYERDGSIMIARIDATRHDMIASQQLLVAYGRSPRIAFDGKTFWASYIEPHGNVVVGMIDETGDLDSTAVDGLTPATDAYDLAVAQGTAWVFAADHNGLGGARICKELQP